jgi:phospholipid/cholesterol/gamma-HCH transport system substrate-binding protein
MQSSPTRDLIVGIFVLVGVLALAYLSLQIGSLSLQNQGGLILFATFDDIGGLSERSAVRIGGVRVGRVTEIALDEDLRPRVQLDLAADLELTIDTLAAIRTSGLLGDQFIALEPGAEDELLVGGEDVVFTESATNLDKLIGAVVHGGGED